MNTRLEFSSEADLSKKENKTKRCDFWQQVTQGSLIGKDNIKLAWCSINQPNSDKAIVICSGRVETYLKYQELIYDLYQQGYSVYAVDHRGQGLSGRLTQNPNKGYVNKFDDYVDDFSFFIDSIVKPLNHKNLFLFAHSMGGAIATLYLERCPHTFKAAVLSSPMYGIRLPVSKTIISSLARLLDSSVRGHEPNYVLGGKDYELVSFEENELTNSKERYQICCELYQSNTDIQLGAPTNHWLTESLNAAERAILAAKSSKTPILLFQAERDRIVDNRGQNKALSESCKKLVIPGAKHEIFIETDMRRNMALNAMLNFFKTYQ